jgi:multicomponent Na+:H+ antiporter subunit D
VERGSQWVLGVLLISSLLNAAYLGPVVYKAYFETSATGHDDDHIREVPLMVVPLVFSALVSLLLGMYPDPVLKLAGMVMP